MDVAQRIAETSALLTPAERRVAEVILDRAPLIAFGTVADLAGAAHVGAATVVRLATKLGFDGFSGLQAAIQRGMSHQLRPAHQRIRQLPGGEGERRLDHHAELEVDNVRASLVALTTDTVGEWCDRAASSTRLWVLSGDASAGVARQFVGDLDLLRGGITLIDGNAVRVSTLLAKATPADVAVTIDVRRYDRWVVDAARRLADAGVWSLAVTDRMLSPLAGCAQRTTVVEAVGAGPFESHVGTLAVLNALVVALAGRLQAEATERLDRAEAAWQADLALTDE